MVLHDLQRQGGQRHRHADLVGEIARVPIDRDPLQLVAVAIPQFGDAAPKALEAAPLRQIAEVGRQPDPAAQGQGGGGLVVTTEGQHGGGGGFPGRTAQHKRFGGIAAGTT